VKEFILIISENYMIYLTFLYDEFHQLKKTTFHENGSVAKVNSCNIPDN